MSDTRETMVEIGTGRRDRGGRPSPGRGHRPRTAGLLLAALLATLAAPAAPAKVPAGVPGGNGAGGERPVPERTLRFTAQDLYGHIDGGAELFLEFGFEELTVESFRVGAVEFDLETYRMSSPAAALGIYLTKCGREEPRADLPGRNTAGPYQITLVAGSDFVQANNFSGDPAAVPVMARLLRERWGDLPPDPPLPQWGLLPAAGRIAGSEMLVRGPFALQPVVTLGEGDVLRLGGTTWGAVADYELPGGGSQTRIYVEYPDEATAAAVLGGILAGLDPYLTVTGRDPDGFRYTDWRGWAGQVRRRGRVLTVMVPAEAAGAAAGEKADGEAAPGEAAGDR